MWRPAYVLTNRNKIALLQRPHSISLKSQLSLWISNKLWPVPLYQLAICFAVGFFLQSSDVSFFNGVKSRMVTLNERISLHRDSWSTQALISAELSLVFLMIVVYLRRAFLRTVLSYTRWLYFFDGSEDKSLWTSIWRFSMKVGMGANPTTFSHEAILPSLPLPNVSMTVKRLLGSLAPYLGVDSSRYKTLRDQLNEYSRKQAAGSQRRLLAKTWTSGNYSTFWWETSTFLTNPKSLILNTNYCAVELRETPPSTTQAARGAVLLYLLANLRSLVFGGCIQPQLFKDTVPLSMTQWKRAFSTTRIPLIEGDELWTFPRSHSQHAVVVCHGSFYKLSILASWQRLFSPKSLQKQLEWILEDASARVDKRKKMSWPLCCLTQLDRREWGATRCEHFAKGTNKQSLDVIERAICILILDTEVAPQSLSERTTTALNGNWGCVWADKGLNFMLSADCRFSVHAEQSALDPAILASVLDCLQCGEIASMYDSEGNAIELEGTAIHSQLPERLSWEIDELSKPLELAGKTALLVRFYSAAVTRSPYADNIIVNLVFSVQVDAENQLFRLPQHFHKS
uniref:Carnitine O-palmitoyltransferase 1, liver isoform n=2 Tax=Schistocephalus solidus TaxID=70667 RepID=A0A0V0J514_SCHSO